MELLGAHQVLSYRPPHALLTCLMVTLLPQRQTASASQLAVLVKLLAVAAVGQALGEEGQEMMEEGKPPTL
ncbi:hypothetical protein HaLaN_31160 [Haematococcus lacustris]|uniref:Uncharacterized protein n=1 Tax=Haematococcus lacustris TaxID=44745 RepID=A0A6A0AIY7_HAELA|nr:hypothetical protein HaLaN_31160 [Haematococcus lacustris]